MAKNPKRPDQLPTLNLPQYFGDEKTYPSMDGSYRGVLGSDGKYRVAWKPPMENLSEGQDAEYGVHIDFENDGFDNQQDIYDYLDTAYGDRPFANLDELERFNKFLNPEQIGDQNKLNLAYLMNVATNYPDELQNELSSSSSELLNNPIVQELIAKYGKK